MAHVEITKLHWEIYQKDTGRCPFCGDNTVEAGKHDFEQLEAWQHIECSECGTEFIEVFRMVGIEEK